jgi:hypothetical protein
MARCGISVTKSVSFRGTAQEFSNTYYYEIPEPLNATVAENLLDLVVTSERSRHASSITFVRGRAWTAGGSQATNQMLIEKPLSGTGTGGTGSTAMDKERAFLVRIRAGVDSKSRPVYLRKWLHLDVGTFGGQAISNTMLQNVDQLHSASRAALVTFMDEIKVLAPAGGGGSANLVSKSGRAITGETQAHPYLEHHQLGDMWRG